jgi:hypothetical protein
MPAGFGGGPSGRTAPGTLIGGRYALRAAVGNGGMGTVWRAADTLLRRDVAVKEVVSPPGLAPSDRDAMYERTLREARAAAALSHPAVVQVYDVVTENGRPWIVMELLDARSLADIVIEDGPLAPRAVAKIGIALLGALEVAHAAGVLHRDVKPANVLIAADGRCVLTDFGVARMPTDVQLTTPGMVLGSPHFISPERAMGGPFGPPSDLFSLGVTLFTAVEGRPPFDRGDPIETMHAVVEDPPAPMVRSGALGNMLYGLLEKDPHRRIDVPTARALLRELLAGPLASQAPPHMMTDPYAVVPAQRVPRPAPPPRPTGQIGGRAMLGAQESPVDRLAPAGGRPATPETNAFPALDHAGDHSGQPAGRGAYRGGGRRRAPDPADRPGAPQWDRPTGQAWAGGRGRAARTAGAALEAARGAVVGLWTTVRDWPRNMRIAAAAGVAVVIVVGVVLVASGGDGGDGGEPGRPPVAQDAAPRQPELPMQQYAERGVSVNVPKGWRRSGTGVYIDFTDRDDAKRRIRILVENASASTQPLKFLNAAGDRLDRTPRSCEAPYREIGLREVEQAGLPSAELEYTCGEGDAMSHGLWRAVVSDGRAYSFRLTAPEARFEESKSIFDEMGRSFRLTAAG